VISRAKALIIDDFRPFREFLSSSLQRPEFEVIGEASNGLEGVRLAAELQPDLILLDIGLPGLNGIAAGRQIRELSPNSKILFISQESSADVVQEVLMLGARGYVHKLRAQSELLPAIEAVLRGEQFVGGGLEFSETRHARVLHQHEILFCSDEQSLLEGLVRFTAAALKVRNPALLLVTEPHGNSLLYSLREQGVDVDEAIRCGTYVSLDANEAIEPAQFLQVVKSLHEAAVRAGKVRPRVAFCGERAGRLWADGKKDEAFQLERFCDELVNSCEVDILCLYPLPASHEDRPAFKSICAGHSAVSFNEAAPV